MAGFVSVQRKERFFEKCRWINRGLTLVTIFLLFVYIPKKIFELLKKEGESKKLDRETRVEEDKQGDLLKMREEMYEGLWGDA